jgi:predicted alpha/beta superfamily hydrolase
MKTGMFITLLMIVSACASARKDVERHESVVMPSTQVRHLHSEQNKQNYRIYVSVPASYYEDPKREFPALYVLDADYSFALAKQITEHLSDRGRLPEMFIFGIAYDGPNHYRLHRTRDYTPSFVAGGGYGADFQKHSGGGPAFARFLERELIPYAEKNFRVSKQRVLAGHSYGGLFASWMMIEQPQVFSGYVAVSPSLWYDQKKIFEQEKKGAASRQYSNTKAFFAVGSRECPRFGTSNDLVGDMQEWISRLDSRKHKGLTLKSNMFEDENHGTVFPAALTRGVLFVLGSS